jgi:hypothetical protein
MTTAADNPAGRHGRSAGRFSVVASVARPETSPVLQAGSQ